jgi:hypothetical protein
MVGAVAWDDQSDPILTAGVKVVMPPQLSVSKSTQSRKTSIMCIPWMLLACREFWRPPPGASPASHMSLVSRVSSKRSKFFFGSNRNKPKLNLFRLFFGLFRETKKKFFRFVSVCFGVSDRYRNNRNKHWLIEKTFYSIFLHKIYTMFSISSNSITNYVHINITGSIIFLGLRIFFFLYPFVAPGWPTARGILVFP